MDSFGDVEFILFQAGEAAAASAAAVPGSAAAKYESAEDAEYRFLNELVSRYNEDEMFFSHEQLQLQLPSYTDSQSSVPDVEFFDDFVGFPGM